MSLSNILRKKNLETKKQIISYGAWLSYFGISSESMNPDYTFVSLGSTFILLIFVYKPFDLVGIPHSLPSCVFLRKTCYVTLLPNPLPSHTQ